MPQSPGKCTRVSESVSDILPGCCPGSKSIYSVTFYPPQIITEIKFPLLVQQIFYKESPKGFRPEMLRLKD